MSIMWWGVIIETDKFHETFLLLLQFWKLLWTSMLNPWISAFGPCTPRGPSVTSMGYKRDTKTSFRCTKIYTQDPLSISEGNRTTDVREETVKVAGWMGGWIDQPRHLLSTSAICQVRSMKIKVMFLGRDDKRTGGLEGQWDLHSSFQTYFPLAIKGLLWMNRNRRAILLVPKYLFLRFLFHYFSASRVPFTDLQKQIILPSSENQPPPGTKTTAVLWPQANTVQQLRTNIKRVGWLDWAQAIKPIL